MVRDNGDLKGKINWFDIELLIKLEFISSDKELINPDDEQLRELTNRCKVHLEKEGFVFYPDYIGYRVVLGKTGKIKEFGIQFKHIK